MSQDPIFYVIRVLGRADGKPSKEDGQYVSGMDVDGNRGRGDIRFTPHVAEARRFVTSDDALAYYHTQSIKYPLRDDGKPNRPLTAYTADIVAMNLPDMRSDTKLRVHQLIQDMLARRGVFARPDVVPMVPTLLRDVRQAVYYCTDIEPGTLPLFDTTPPLPFLTLPYKVIYIELPVQMGMSRRATGQVDMMPGKIGFLCQQVNDGGLHVTLFTYAEHVWSVSGYADVDLTGEGSFNTAFQMRQEVLLKHRDYLERSLFMLLRFLSALYTHEHTVTEVTGPSEAAKKKAAKQGKTLPSVPIAYKKIVIHLDQPKVQVIKPKVDNGGTHASPCEHPRQEHWAYRRNPDGTVKLRPDGTEIKWKVKATIVNKGKTIVKEEKEFFVTH